MYNYRDKYIEPENETTRLNAGWSCNDQSSSWCIYIQVEWSLQTELSLSVKTKCFCFIKVAVRQLRFQNKLWCLWVPLIKCHIQIKKKNNYKIATKIIQSQFFLQKRLTMCFYETKKNSSGLVWTSFKNLLSNGKRISAVLGWAGLRGALLCWHSTHTRVATRQAERGEQRGSRRCEKWK